MSELVRVVVVDDAADLRSLLRARLRLTGRFEVVAEGATGADAMLLCQRHAPDLVLLDVSMPDMDGLEALVGIRERAPRTAVVMFSGFEEEGLAERALALGAADYVQKSVFVEELVERMLAAAGSQEPEPQEVAEDPEIRRLLAEHRERFRAAFDDAAIGMATLTLTGQVVRANTAFTKLVRSDGEPLVGRPYPTLVEALARGEVVDAFAEVAAGKEGMRSVEHRLAGTPTWVSATIAAVTDASRVPLYLLLQLQDVTARRAAEEELRRSEERFRLFVSTVGDYAIFMLDPEGIVESWNVGAERTNGYSADEIIGRHFSAFYTEADKARDHPAQELEIARREGRFEEEGWRLRKDGSTFWASVLITAVRDASGALLGFSKVTRDMTERRRLAEEREKVAAERSEFLAIAAHELRTPVAVVHGFASTLRDHWAQLEDPDRREMVEAMARGGERLSRLVEDLLTSSRLDSGALDVHPVALDLGEALAEAVTDLSATSASPVSVTVEPLSIVVRADRGRLQQMLGNYLTNALRYGRPPFAVAATVSSDGAEVRVTDSGVGVPEELVGRLFDKFSRGSDREGTGLGLYIVRELARAQGGDAWYETVPGGGSCFALRLPLARPSTSRA